MPVVDLKALIKARVAAADDTIDISDRSQFVGLVANPIVSALGSVESLLSRMEIASDLRRSGEMTDDEINQVAANWGVTRKEKISSRGSVELHYASPQDLVIEIGQQFIARNGTTFVATERVAITASQMSTAFDSDNGWYVVTVPGVESTDSGTEFDIGAGDIVIMTDASTNVLSVTNPNEFSASQAGETNVELAARIIKSASTRNYASNDSAVATLIQDPRVRDASAIGAGDPEMIRDIKYGMHCNGMQDIYVHPEEDLVPYTKFLATADLANSPVYLIEADADSDARGPFVYIQSVEYGNGADASFISDGELAQGDDYTLDFFQSTEGLKNSAEEAWTITFTRLPASTSIRVVLLRAPLISALQDELPSLGERSTAHQTMYKCVTPIFLNINAAVKPSVGASSDPEFYANVISGLIKSSPIAETIDESDIITALSNAGADRVDIPVLASAKVLYPDLSYAAVTFDEEISAAAITRSSATARNMSFYPGTITVSILA